MQIQTTILVDEEIHEAVCGYAADQGCSPPEAYRRLISQALSPYLARGAVDSHLKRHRVIGAD